jgi:hypothetical protein
MDEFKDIIQLEYNRWGSIDVVSRDQLDGYLQSVSLQLARCLDNQLAVEAEQLELIGRFQELQAFGEEKLRLSSNSSLLEHQVENFCHACHDGDVQSVETLLKACGTRSKPRKFLLQRNSVGACGFHLACREGHVGVVTMLLKVGFPIDYVDSWHELAPVFWAVSKPVVSCKQILLVLSAHNGINIRCDGKCIYIYLIFITDQNHH